MIKPNQHEIFENLKARADIIWGEALDEKSTPPKLLGASELDRLGERSWAELARVSFVAPNFYLNRESPNFIESLHCLDVGSDRDDRPLYYFLSTGHYALSSDGGLIFVANSSLELFECFLIYGEWVEKILATYGPNALNDNDFLTEDTYVLENLLTEYFGDYYKDSFWEKEVARLRGLASRK